MADVPTRQPPDRLVPAESLATRRKPRFADESEDYARAREALLTDEIKLRRHLEAVAERRRHLPDGPLITHDYRFLDGNGEEVGLAEMFGRHDTLITYFWMFAPERPRPCPMCTNFLGPLEANAADIGQRAALAVLGRSPVERQIGFARERGWRDLRFYQTLDDDYAMDVGGLDPVRRTESPALVVYRKDRERKVRLFWMGELSGVMSDPGQDTHCAPDPAPLWAMLDLTPGGRGSDWYPKLVY